MALMPTGNDSVWMIRIRDRGVVYKIDLLHLLKTAGVKKDAWGNALPGNQGQIDKKKHDEIKKKMADRDQKAEIKGIEEDEEEKLDESLAVGSEAIIKEKKKK